MLDIWQQTDCVWMTGYWGWRPDRWGCVGWSNSTRPKTVMRQTTDPFLLVAYVTTTARKEWADLRGLVAGVYEISHISGDRDEFTDPVEWALEPTKWRYSLKAIRAWSFLPEFRPKATAVLPALSTSGQAVANHATALGQESIDRLRNLPYIEVPVYGGSNAIDPIIHVPTLQKNKVSGGAWNSTGYCVPPEPEDTPKELYLLRLDGDTCAMLGEEANGRAIYKIGLSISPETRRSAFQKSMPRGAFKWEIQRTTKGDGHEPYPGFKVAVAGEEAMKDFLAQNADWLGGEFYAVKPDLINQAWVVGREAALKVKDETNP